MKKKAVDTTKIPIIFSTDNNYAFCTSVAMTSIIENTAVEALCFYILIDDSFSKKSKEIVNKIGKIYPDIRINFIRVDLNVFNFVNVDNNSRITIAAIYRLVIAKLLKEIDKCIYIDCDVIVKLDIAELFSLNIKDNYIAGVRDAIVQEEMEVYKSYAQVIGIASMRNYINSGVLLMNLKKIREDELVEKYLSYITIDSNMLDQDILNICCDGRIYYLPLKYNFPKRFYNRSYKLAGHDFCKEDLHVNYNDVIIHYAEKYKPWTHVRCRGKDEWWFYANKIGSTELLCDIKSQIQLRSKQEDAEYLYNKCKNKKNIIVFGFSDIGKRASEFLLKINANFINFSDNDIKKQGKKYRNIQVLAIEDIISIYGEDIFIINTSQRYANTINHQLQELGIKSQNIFNYQYKNKLYYITITSEYYVHELEQIALEEFGIVPGKIEKNQIIGKLISGEYQRLKSKYYLEEWIFSKYF